MESVSTVALEQAVQLLGKPELSHADVEAKLRFLGMEELVAQRLATFVPEAFGVVATSHMEQKLVISQTFSALDEKKRLEEIPFSAEPIFELAMRRAEFMYLEGPKDVFETISLRGSVMEVINDALDNGTAYDGATLMIETEIPAEVYRKPTFWKWLMGPLWTTETE